MAGPERQPARPMVFKGDHKQRQTLKGKRWNGPNGLATGNRQQERNLRRMGAVLIKPGQDGEPS